LAGLKKAAAEAKFTPPVLLSAVEALKE